jgi:hypothetical protein
MCSDLVRSHQSPMDSEPVEASKFGIAVIGEDSKFDDVEVE